MEETMLTELLNNPLFVELLNERFQIEIIADQVLLELMNERIQVELVNNSNRILEIFKAFQGLIGVGVGLVLSPLIAKLGEVCIQIDKFSTWKAAVNETSGIRLTPNGLTKEAEEYWISGTLQLFNTSNMGKVVKNIKLILEFENHEYSEMQVHDSKRPLDLDGRLTKSSSEIDKLIFLNLPPKQFIQKEIFSIGSSNIRYLSSDYIDFDKLDSLKAIYFFYKDHKSKVNLVLIDDLTDDKYFKKKLRKYRMLTKLKNK